MEHYSVLPGTSITTFNVTNYPEDQMTENNFEGTLESEQGSEQKSRSLVFLSDQKSIESDIIAESFQTDKMETLTENSTTTNAMADDNTSFFCVLCCKGFSVKSSYKRHMRQSHTHEGMIKCKMCDRKFLNQTDLRRHNETAHLGLRFDCDECDKTYRTRGGLNCHKLTHKGIYRYLCLICGRGFNYKSEYESHTTSHSGLKPHMCDQCGSKFQTKGGLRKHRETCGVAIKRFTCETCGKKFKASRFLDDHIRIQHEEGGTLKQCSTCGDFFRHRSSLYNHMKKTGHEWIYARRCNFKTV